MRSIVFQYVLCLLSIDSADSSGLILSASRECRQSCTRAAATRQHSLHTTVGMVSVGSNAWPADFALSMVARITAPGSFGHIATPPLLETLREREIGQVSDGLKQRIANSLLMYQALTEINSRSAAQKLGETQLPVREAQGMVTRRLTDRAESDKAFALCPLLTFSFDPEEARHHKIVLLVQVHGASAEYGVTTPIFQRVAILPRRAYTIASLDARGSRSVEEWKTVRITINFLWEAARTVIQHVHFACQLVMAHGAAQTKLSAVAVRLGLSVTSAAIDLRAATASDHTRLEFHVSRVHSARRTEVARLIIDVCQAHRCERRVRRERNQAMAAHASDGIVGLARKSTGSTVSRSSRTTARSSSEGPAGPQPEHVALVYFERLDQSTSYSGLRNAIVESAMLVADHCELKHVLVTSLSEHFEEWFGRFSQVKYAKSPFSPEAAPQCSCGLIKSREGGPLHRVDRTVIGQAWRS